MGMGLSLVRVSRLMYPECLFFTRYGLESHVLDWWLSLFKIVWMQPCFASDLDLCCKSMKCSIQIVITSYLLGSGVPSTQA